MQVTIAKPESTRFTDVAASVVTILTTNDRDFGGIDWFCVLLDRLDFGFAPI